MPINNAEVTWDIRVLNGHSLRSAGRRRQPSRPRNPAGNRAIFPRAGSKKCRTTTTNGRQTDNGPISRASDRQLPTLRASIGILGLVRPARDRSVQSRRNSGGIRQDRDGVRSGNHAPSGCRRQRMAPPDGGRLPYDGNTRPNVESILSPSVAS
jgi:hypothetical protein